MRNWRRLNRVGVLVLLVIAGEVTARFVAGFGDPPIAVLDSEIEYYPKPSESYTRFNNRIQINSHGMRSKEIPIEKSSANQFRLLVLGDSVVYGGHRMDQSEIATELLPKLLSPRLERTVTVANIAASSWGPPNILAYLNRFGTFDADAAVLVLSNHDITDVPQFIVGIEPYRTRKPWCALHDAFQSVYERVFQPRQPRAEEGNRVVDTRPDREIVLGAVGQIFDRLQADGVKVFVALHQDRRELSNGPGRGHDAFLGLANQRQIPVIELGPRFQDSLRRGRDPYRDVIHPSAAGMEVMAEEIANAIGTWWDEDKNAR